MLRISISHVSHSTTHLQCGPGSPLSPEGGAILSPLPLKTGLDETMIAAKFQQGLILSKFLVILDDYHKIQGLRLGTVKINFMLL